MGGGSTEHVYGACSGYLGALQGLFGESANRSLMIRTPVQDLYLRSSQLCLTKQIGVVYVCARAHTCPMPLSLGCRDVPQHKVMRHPVFGVISSSLPPHTTTRIRILYLGSSQAVYHRTRPRAYACACRAFQTEHSRGGRPADCVHDSAKHPPMRHHP